MLEASGGSIAGDEGESEGETPPHSGEGCGDTLEKIKDAAKSTMPAGLLFPTM